MARIFEPSGQDELSPDLDADIQRLSLDEAIGVIRSLVGGGWVSPDAVRLSMRVQSRALRYPLGDGHRSFPT